MKRRGEQAANWMYRGVWRLLTNCFKVPEHPPTLPAEPGEFFKSFHPSPRYLSYRKLYFWIGLLVIDIVILVGWLIILFANPPLAALLALPALALAVLPDIVVYVALHLRYDTMWYVMTDRSLRCRRGIWTILEHTITFENVQDIHVRQGPVQQLFGISTLVIETAGAAEPEGHNQFAVGNKAIMEGLDNPDEIRELILERVKRSRLAGLGDEQTPLPAPERWRTEHLHALEEILQEIRSS
ncbi:MAG: PH domain-containing protein [Gammaproteobacteria bacterium]|nr:PH domain-containing protein [Gammaproteobacteria bacterium]